MKGIKSRWYIVCFAAIMGFTAGAATALDSGYIESAFQAMGEAQGGVLLSLALLSMLWNTALYSFCRIISGKGGIALSVFAVWLKAVLVGLFCRGLWANIRGINVLLILLTVFGGACICVGMIMEGEEAKNKHKGLAVWLCGVTAEGIIIPSAVRTWALIFN